jgi:hypothetical protein
MRRHWVLQPLRHTPPIQTLLLFHLRWSLPSTSRALSRELPRPNPFPLTQARKRLVCKARKVPGYNRLLKLHEFFAGILAHNYDGLSYVKDWFSMV